MKVLFISNLFPPNQIGGYEVLCAHVASLLAERGHDVHVLTTCYGRKVASTPRFAVTQGLRLICGDTIYQPFAHGRIRQTVIEDDNAIVTSRVIDRTKPDVIFAWNLQGLQSSYIRSLEGLGTPVVAMLTDNWLAAMLSPDFIGQYFKSHVYGDQLGHDPTPAPGVADSHISAIFGSHYMQKLYETAGLRFLNTTVVHNGVDISADLTLARTSREVLRNGSAGPVRLLFAGRLVRLKGAHTAIEALHMLKRKPEPDALGFLLTIIGDSTDADYIAELRSLVSRWDLSQQVSFLPPVRESELPDLFRDNDIFVFPSLYEPFSLTLIHAMAAGIPTVASRAGGNVEIVTDEQTGLLFAPGDAEGLAAGILRFASDGALRERASTAARTIASRFTIDRMVAEMETYLAERM